MTQTRRTFLKTGTALMGAGALLGATGGPALAATRLTGVSYLPPSYRALSFGSAGFVERLNASDAVDVDYYDSGKLLKADEQLAALRAGTIDFMFHTTSYITRSVPILGITGLPGVIEALYENPERLRKGSPLFDLINEELAKEDLYMVSMMGNVLEPEYLWSSAGAPIRSIADVKGKKVRVVSFEGTKVVEGFDGAAVRLPSSELYLGLQRGTVDAAVANISTIIGRSLQEQLHHVYRLPITGFGIGLFVTPQRWEKMGDEVRAAFETAADWFDANGAKEANEVIYRDDYWPAIEAAGIEVIDPTGEDLAALDAAAEEVRAAWIADVGEETGHRAIALATGQAG
ncbi:C4-dicarboxylate ABC transporter substrate-binding protein [Rhodovulum sp. BSW8]|uniref:TRAP transporter substrate-binding protein n=1 Tax=Rhodovulum sp. BSW8 TaxID=2259645 RepID=UPI000DE4244D|nr:TRAP transporter substrate-binding protein DctP [Rhodovulum sp. BSW8]RBO52416.1 C4-dicarboxylate ABC transporter substrate-binding protein [Rhodovulum sp. BSW8]